MKYKSRPIFVEASQWFQHYDHPKVTHYSAFCDDIWARCHKCNRSFMDHGWIIEPGIRVCSGDWVVINNNNEISVYKPDEFEAMYERDE